eukprot:CAMPEP_0170603960 /NCGR_PEP_ID=MMETSP0224-20130122/19178_1 /TAXON_ID=285029 /ORGANISM="Togula jolla, Strain CCCM 725" /LENGTH=477 /DNA_ID=CAMNT_0010928851 /DNA_START=92 /DNA_END=1525 /DNA_ORIENTATION=+
MAPTPLPAALLEPAWTWPGEVPDKVPVDLGRAFDVRSSAGFSICARVRRSRGNGPGAALQKGGPPLGWRFEAPSDSGVVAFAVWPQGEARTSEVDAMAEPASGTLEGEAPHRGEHDVGRTRLDDGDWHHVAVVFCEGELRAFVDGQRDGEVSLDVQDEASGEVSVVSRGDDGMELLRELLGFSEALDDAQVSELAAGSRTLPTGLYLPFSPADVPRFWRLHSRSSLPEGDAERGDQDAREFLVGVLGCTGNELQVEALCDFFFDLLETAQSISLTPRKTAVFVGIMQAVFALMHSRSKVSKVVGEPQTLSEVFLRFRNLLLSHALLPGDEARRLGIFSSAEVRLLTDFVASSLFAHFLLYQSVLLCPLPQVTVRRLEAVLERPRPPPELRRGKLLQQAQPEADEVPGGNAQATGNRELSAAVTADAEDTRPTEEGQASLAEHLDMHLSEAAAAAEAQLEAAIKERDKALDGKVGASA